VEARFVKHLTLWKSNNRKIRFQSLFLRKRNEIPPDEIGTGFFNFMRLKPCLKPHEIKKDRRREADARDFISFAGISPNGISQSSLF
jgi:hypothetical protein